MRTKKKPKIDQAAQHFQQAVKILERHPIFTTLLHQVSLNRKEKNRCPETGWAVACRDGTIQVHPTRLAEPEEWVYVLAHCLLHYGMGHFNQSQITREWNAACDLAVSQFLTTLKLGKAPLDFTTIPEAIEVDERKLFEQFQRDGIPQAYNHYGTAGEQGDMSDYQEPLRYSYLRRLQFSADWERYFAIGLSEAVTSAVNVANGLERSFGEKSDQRTAAQRAREWFINRYPLLGALASAFKIIEDARMCQRLDISIAAVDATSREIYINPSSGLTEEELRFVMAHELLHVGLRHDVRSQGRDAYLWNVACDYVVNGWLIEMQVGCMPTHGLLHDPKLKGLSAETIYDLVVSDMRRFRKLATLRGIGVGDILGHSNATWWQTAEGLELDEFYRSCLGQGLNYAQCSGRGLFPKGLIEEIEALSQPPIPWDVELARWFDEHFQPLEKVRTYARLNRRQSVTPEIPRPNWVKPEIIEKSRTFGVILDTSGSMDKKLLAKALGAIASYAIAKVVTQVRVVFCDAYPYDAGYMTPEAIADKVHVKGRGGTVLQPAIELLQTAEDFPPQGPILIITDGACDRLQIKREHAYLVPKGYSLPFPAKGPVFYIS